MIRRHHYTFVIWLILLLIAAGLLLGDLFRDINREDRMEGMSAAEQWGFAIHFCLLAFFWSRLKRSWKKCTVRAETGSRSL